MRNKETKYGKRKMKKLLLIILFTGMSAEIAISAFAFENGDLQFWNTESIEKKVNEKLKLKVEEELRLGGDMTELYYLHTDIGVSYNVTEGLDFGLNYRQVSEKKDEEWKQENRPHGNITFKGTWQGIKISDRNRFELCCPEEKDDKWRYRNKISFVFPWKWTKFNIQPYSADEVFVDFHGDKLTRNRLYSGINAELLKYLKTDIFYLWELNKKDKNWTYNNVIGVKANISF